MGIRLQYFLLQILLIDFIHPVVLYILFIFFLLFKSHPKIADFTSL